MADYQRIVDEIRFFLQGADQTLREEHRDWATAYAEAVREANERLRRCKEFLDQNLRSEAIHVADADPNLIEMVSYLDFSELPDWENFCADHSLTAPPKLLLLVAEDLNTAYGEVQPLKEPLRRLRRLALVRAPLDQRLEVMRKLAELDPESHFWREDIATFELTRHRELEEEARSAAARGDVEKLKALVQELQSDKWLHKPSEELLNSVKKAYVKATRSSGRERLEHLLPQLVEAAQQGNVDAARRIRSDWEQAAREARLGPDDVLAREAAPALDWIAQHDQHAAAEAAFQVALASLTTELNRGPAAAIPALERLRQEALAYGRPLPAEVEARYVSTIEGIRASATWQRRLFLTGTLAGLLIVVGLLGFFVVMGMRGSAVRAQVDRMQALLDGGDLGGATRLRGELKEQSPELLAAPQMIPLLDRLAKLEQEDESRAARLKLHLETAQQFLDRDALAEASKELEAAARLAQHGHESTEIERLRKQVQLASTDRTKGNERKVVEATRDATDHLDRAAQALDRDDLQEATDRLTQARKLITSAAELSTSTPDDVRNRFKVVQTRLDEQERRLADIRAANVLETQIAHAVADLTQSPSVPTIDRVAALLKEFVDKYPQSPRTAGLRPTLAEFALAKGAIRWADELRPWNSVESLTRLKYTQADSRAKLCADLLRTYAGAPDSARIKSYQTYLASVARQNDTIATLQSVFNSALLKDGWMVRQGDKRWYSPDGKIADEEDTIASRLAKGAQSIRFQAIFSSDGRKREKRLQTPSSSPAECLPAPQTVLSAKVRDQLEKLRVSLDWERGVVDILDTIRRDEQTDPLLRVILLSSVLQRSCEASTVLERAAQPCLKAIQDSQVDLFAPWMDPDDDRANAARVSARKLLADKFPDLQRIPEEIDRARTAVAQPLLTRYEVVGFLRSYGRDDWRCEIAPERLTSLQGTGLVVIHASSGASNGQWKSIGSISDGAVVLRAEPGDLQEGRLVFAVRRLGN